MRYFNINNSCGPIYKASLAFLILGYIFYIMVVWLPVPEWGREFVDELIPTFKSLLSAKRVAAERGSDAFPAQMMILYGVCGCCVLPLIFCLNIYFPDEHRILYLMEIIQHNSKKKISKFKFFFGGVFLVIGSCFYIAFWFVDTTKNSIGWRAQQIYSADFLSVTLFFLLTPILISLLILSSASMFYLAVNKSSHSINEKEKS